MDKIPVYKSLLDNKTTMGVPTIIFPYLGLFLVILYLILGTALVIMPTALIFIMLKIVSRKDSRFLSIYFTNLNNPQWLGF